MSVFTLNPFYCSRTTLPVPICLRLILLHLQLRQFWRVLLRHQLEHRLKLEHRRKKNLEMAWALVESIQVINHTMTYANSVNSLSPSTSPKKSSPSRKNPNPSNIFYPLNPKGRVWYPDGVPSSQMSISVHYCALDFVSED